MPSLMIEMTDEQWAETLYAIDRKRRDVEDGCYDEDNGEDLDTEAWAQDLVAAGDAVANALQNANINY